MLLFSTVFSLKTVSSQILWGKLNYFLLCTLFRGGILSTLQFWQTSVWILDPTAYSGNYFMTLWLLILHNVRELSIFPFLTFSPPLYFPNKFIICLLQCFTVIILFNIINHLDIIYYFLSLLFNKTVFKLFEKQSSHQVILWIWKN